MVLGIVISQTIPGFADFLGKWEIAGTSVPIAIGLLVMMYPPLAKVRYDKTAEIATDTRLMVVSLVLNWLVGPLLMFVLAWLFLPDSPELRTGLIIVGLARCIAMVLVWNDMACGDREAAAVLVAVNSVFQIAMFGVLGWFYLQLLPGWLGLPTTDVHFTFWAIVLSVVFYLGVPLLAGVLSRVIGEAKHGRRWYEDKFLPAISPFALIGLLYTIVLLFALQGQQVMDNPGTVAKVGLPLLGYFAIMFFIALFAARGVGLNYARSATVAFTAAGNNFELAIAVSIGTFGMLSPQALAGTIGPLVEVPVLVGLVYVSLWLAPKLFPGDPTIPTNSTAKGAEQ